MIHEVKITEMNEKRHDRRRKTRMGLVSKKEISIDGLAKATDIPRQTIMYNVTRLKLMLEYVELSKTMQVLDSKNNSD